MSQIPVISTWGYQNYAVRSNKYRYIRYADGSEELYDHEVDNLEWNNLANDKRYASVIKELSRTLPDPSKVRKAENPEK